MSLVVQKKKKLRKRNGGCRMLEYLGEHGHICERVDVRDFVPPAPPGVIVRPEYWQLFERMRDMEVYRLWMTPPWAAEMLEKSPFKQRKVIKKNLQRLIRAILTGRYQATHQGIAQTREQAIIDGQHRMLASIQTNTCIPIFFFRNVLEETVWSVDRGALRTVDQDLYMHGVTNGTTRCAMLRRCIEILGYDSTDVSDKREYDRWEPLFGDGIEFALALKGAASSPVTGGFAFAYPMNPECIKDCASRFISGARMEEDDPMLRLREHCKLPQNRNRGQKPQALLLRATMYALCKAVRGLPSKKIIRDNTGVSFFRRFYHERFLEVIKVNTENALQKTLGPKSKKKKKVTKRKRIDDYEE